MAMDETHMRLDGNAAAGMLQELFVHETTTTRAACAVCGRVAELGAQHLYMHPRAPGAVIRCNTCSNLLMVVVHAGGRYRVGVQGCLWLEMEEPAASA